jgi:cation diffusion facilitator family transporter
MEDHAHEHRHEDQHRHHEAGLRGWLKNIFIPHSHDPQQAALDAVLATERGIRAVMISLGGLLATALFQVVIVFISGSVALLADTIHNFSDALTAIPLGIAFWLSRRASDRRYTYGFGRAEDIAGVIIVLMILFTAGEAIYQSIHKIIQPEPIRNLGWVAAAAIIGFLGNELVAVYRIRTGREINSAALVADGYHARTDGFTSLAVLAGTIGAWLGFPLLDPLVGLGIGVAILVIVWRTGREIWLRIMDAVDPQITDQIERTAAKPEGVIDVHSVSVRWIGHRQRAELHIIVDCQMPTCDSHRVAEMVRHELFHALPALVEATVHVDPCECEHCGDVHLAQHHNPAPASGD